jgi:hypothetical protein
MVRKPKQGELAPEGDPKEGDAILKRMLMMKPKPHKEMVKGRTSKPNGGKDVRK